ncbi:hypothetical protein HKX48_003122 [Thoreauomyces humboldtii]|nr:hypothetical protein HKX48_003122 [Thoreauomyces humboldtii]
MSRPDYRLSGESMPHHLAIDRVALALAEEALLDATIELRQFCPLGYPLHDTSIAASSFRFRSALDDHLEQTAATLVKETMKETIAVLTRERQMEHLASTVARDILELASSELVQDAKERDAAIARVRKTVSTYSLDAYYLDDAVDDEEAEAAEEEEEEKSTKPFDSAHPSRDLTALSRKRQTLDLMAANTPATREHLDGLLAILAQVRAQTQSNTAAAGRGSTAGETCLCEILFSHP